MKHKKLIPILIVIASVLLVIAIAAIPSKTFSFREVGQKLFLALADAIAPEPAEDDEKETQPQRVAVKEIVPIPEFAETLRLPGSIEANFIVRVSAEVAGRIEKISCAEGARCKKGDLLMALNTDLLQAAYDQAKAQADFDKTQLERIRKLHDGGSATSEDLDQVKANTAGSLAAMAAAEAKLERATIHAPNSGILNDILVEEGEYLQAGTPVVEIVDVDTVKVVVDVPERDIPFVKMGDKAHVLATIRGQAAEVGSTVTFIGQIADPATRKTPVEISVDNRNGLLRTGQSVDVYLTRRLLKNAIFIPHDAIIPFETTKAVYVAVDGKAVRKDVTLGIVRGAKRQVLSGLKAGDQLIVSGHRYVGPNQPIEIQEPIEAMAQGPQGDEN